MSVLASTAYGLLGAVTPEMLRLYALRHSAARFRAVYFAATVSLVVVSGAVVALMAGTNSISGPIPALLIGASVPLLLSRLLGTGMKAQAKGTAFEASRRMDYRDILEAAEANAEFSQSAPSGTFLRALELRLTSVHRLNTEELDYLVSIGDLLGIATDRVQDPAKEQATPSPEHPAN